MTGLAVHLKPNLSDVASALIDYTLSQHPSKFIRETLPRDESLLELGVLDSAGVMESRAAKRTASPRRPSRSVPAPTSWTRGASAIYGHAPPDPSQAETEVFWLLC